MKHECVGLGAAVASSDHSPPSVIPGLAGGENPEPTIKRDDRKQPFGQRPVVGSGFRFAAPE